jgi:hypothetical protein
MIHYSENSHFQFRLLTAQNITDFIPQEAQKKIKYILSLDQSSEPSQLVDLYRSYLIYEQGGIWVDSTTFFIQNFDQIKNIKLDNQNLMDPFEADFLSLSINSNATLNEMKR